MNRKLLLVSIVAVLLPGCATWNGTLNRREPFKPLNGVHQVGRVWFEKPVVIDNDKNKDFTPIIDTFATSLQAEMANSACQGLAFKNCLTSPPRDGGAYKITTRVEIQNYRPGRGGFGLALLGGIFLPPIIGMAWAFPVASGTIQFRISWTMTGPDGDTVAEGSGSTSRGAEYTDKSAEYYLPNFGSFLKIASAAILDREGPATPQSIQDPAGTGGTWKKTNPIVAVFDIEDQSKKMQRDVLDQLTGYLGTKLTQIAGFKIVPRDQLRLRLSQEKSSTYKECYDQSCQIELGRAIAAEKSLSTQIIRIGNACAITSSLFDLRTETTEGAASIETGCADEDLMRAMTEIAEQLKPADPAPTETQPSPNSAIQEQMTPEQMRLIELYLRTHGGKDRKY